MPMYKCDSCGYEWATHATRKPQKCPNPGCLNPKEWNSLTEDKNKRNQISRIVRRRKHEMPKVR